MSARRERRDDGLGGRHPEHLAEDEDQDHEQRSRGPSRSTFRSRNGTPIIGIATPSFTDGGDVRRPPREPKLEEGDEQRVDDHRNPPGRRCEVVRGRERDRQQRLGCDVGHRREDRREHEEQERMVVDDHTERAARGRRRGRVRAGARYVAEGDRKRGAPPGARTPSHRGASSARRAGAGRRAAGRSTTPRFWRREPRRTRPPAARAA